MHDSLVRHLKHYKGLIFFRDICVATQALLSKHKMAPQDGVCQLSGHDQRVFTYVLTLNDSSEQGSRCMASVVAMHCPVFSMGVSSKVIVITIV